MASTAGWRSRPVFITSTFRDMHAERDWLRNLVLPALEERLRARRHHLEPIDLRWGVDPGAIDEGRHWDATAAARVGERGTGGGLRAWSEV